MIQQIVLPKYNSKLEKELIKLFHESDLPLHFNKTGYKGFTNYQRISLIVIFRRENKSIRDFIDWLKESKWVSWLDLKRVPGKSTFHDWLDLFDMKLIRELINFSIDTNSQKVAVKTKNPLVRWDNLKREYDVLKTLSDRGISIAPTPYDYNERVLGKPIEVIEFFEGKTLSQGQIEILENVASLAKKIHSLEEVFTNDTRKYKSHLGFLSEIEEYVSMRMGGLSQLGIPRETMEVLRKVVSRSKGILSDREIYFQGNDLTFCHKDFKPDNLVVSPEGIIKGIDWEYADVCDPAFDLALFANGMKLSPELKRTFLEYYGIETDPSLEQRTDTYIEYGNIPSLIWCLDRLFNPEYKTIKRERVEKYLAKARRNIGDLANQEIIREGELSSFDSIFENS